MEGSIVDIVDSLENRISKLLHKYEIVQQQNMYLKKSLEELEQESTFQIDQLEQLERQNSSLKNANAMLGSDEYKRETKHKINALVKEIDMCVAQLSK